MLHPADGVRVGNDADVACEVERAAVLEQDVVHAWAREEGGLVGRDDLIVSGLDHRVADAVDRVQPATSSRPAALARYGTVLTASESQHNSAQKV